MELGQVATSGDAQPRGSGVWEGALLCSGCSLGGEWSQVTGSGDQKKSDGEQCIPPVQWMGTGAPSNLLLQAVPLTVPS